MIEIVNNVNGRYVNMAVVGIGGAGNNAIDRMKQEGVNLIDFIGINTDIQDLNDCLADKKVQIGCKLTGGFGAGANPEVGEKSANENLEEIKEALKDYKLVFITGGMGGGTGTGAIPVVAKTCKELGILTVAIVTKPFECEGMPRKKAAETAIEKLKECVDTLIIIANDRILDVYPDLFYIEAFKNADEVLMHAVRGITNIINNKGVINLDYNDIYTILNNKGLAHMGIGTVSGNESVMDALTKAINSPLLETNIAGASHVLFNVEGKASMKEINEAARTIQSIAGENVHILWGTVSGRVSDDFCDAENHICSENPANTHIANRDCNGKNDEIVVTVIATGISDVTEKNMLGNLAAVGNMTINNHPFYSSINPSNNPENELGRRVRISDTKSERVPRFELEIPPFLQRHTVTR